MSLRDYNHFVIRACQLEHEDPVAFWQSLDHWQCLLSGRLMSGSELHFQTPQGTDLRVNTAGMRWFSSPGRKNFPDGEVYSGPNLDAPNGGAEGVVVFDKRCVYQGRSVRNARIVIENGRATDVSADEGEEFLISMLDQDEGARRIGEVAFGTNRAITKPTGQILYDEKMGGTFHLAFGAGYPKTETPTKAPSTGTSSPAWEPDPVSPSTEHRSASTAALSICRRKFPGFDAVSSNHRKSHCRIFTVHDLS